MEEIEKKAFDYLSRGIIEAQIDFSQEKDIPTVVVKFEYEIDYDDAFLYKNLISFIHSFTDFSPILYEGENTFLIFLKDRKLHAAVAFMQKFQKEVKKRFKVAIDRIGITMVDPKDTYKSIADRIQRYFVLSKFSSQSQMFYGTKDFDFFEKEGRGDMLSKLFQENSTVNLCNFYQGVPILQEAKIVKYSGSVLVVKIKAFEASFLEYEDFVFLQHDMLPNTLKARIAKVDKRKYVVAFDNFVFLDNSAADRENVRIEPDKQIRAVVDFQRKKLFEGFISSISASSIVLKVNKEQLEKLQDKDLQKMELELRFQVVSQEGFVNSLSMKASVFSIIGKQVILSIYPTSFPKSKIESYVYEKQNELMLQLKARLMGNQNILE